MLKIYLIDNELHAIELLTDYIKNTPGIELCGYSQDPVKGLHEISENAPDILFLDIEMPVLSGLDLFRLVNGKVRVVFTTAFAPYAVDSYNLDASDFLLKPIRYERFVQCINKLQIAGSNDNQQPAKSPAVDFIFIQSGVKSKMIKLKFNDIVYIESIHNYQIINLGAKRHVVYLSMKDLLEKLPDDIFVRIHKSFIINYDKVQVVEGNRAFISDTQSLTIGSQYKEMFFKKVQQHLLRKR